jgi:hypothetical protein
VNLSLSQRHTKKNVLRGLRWGGSSYSEEYSLSLEEIGCYDLRITHYYGLATIKYDSIFDFAFHLLTHNVTHKNLGCKEKQINAMTRYNFITY